MKIYANQLPQQLNKGLQPCYLIFGDEPFQIEQARRSIKQKAREIGIEEIIRLVDDDQFEYSTLLQHCQEMSLFASSKLIELQLTSAKTDKQASDALEQAAQTLSSDTILVIYGGKLETSQTKKKWFKQLDKIGCYIPVYNIEGRHLMSWLQTQLIEKNMVMDRQAQQSLIDITSGNLLACAQELEKLALIYPQQNIGVEQVINNVAEQSSYSVFQLMDCVWQGNKEQVITIMERLKSQELEVMILLWAVQKDVNLLFQLNQQLTAGMDVDGVFNQHKVWKNKQQPFLNLARSIPAPVLSKAIVQLNHIDTLVKSFHAGCFYTMVTQVLLMLMGSQQLAELPFPFAADVALQS